MSSRTQARQVFTQLAFEVLGQVHRAAPRSHLGPLVVCAVAFAAVSAVVAGRLVRSRVAVALGALAGAALAVPIVLTLFRDGGRPGNLAGLRACALTDPILLSGDGLANLALFGPAAFLAVLAIGRPLLVATGVAAVSLSVELLQAVLSVEVCDSSDVQLNVLGGSVAALAAAVVRSVSGSGLCRRSC